MAEKKPLKIASDSKKDELDFLEPEETQEKEEILEKVITVKRVSKVVKGGKRFSFSAAVVVGDQNGKLGFGFGKGTEVASAIKKALIKARKNFFQIPLKDTTIPHETIGRCDAAIVLLKPASQGTGVIAGGPVRAVCEVAGIKDILTKSLKSHNPINVAKATIDGLQKLRGVRFMGKMRSL